jgi:hypothetical protein
MKKASLILVFIIVFSPIVKAQSTGVIDTLTYLQTIVNTKSLYIGKPFRNLADSLKIEIKFFSPQAPIHHDKSRETSTAFGWFTPLQPEDIAFTYPHLVVYWYPVLNAEKSRMIYNKREDWPAAIIKYYSNAIISDIKISE